MKTNTIIWGDCLLELAELKDNSIDSIVTDPPYGLEFMGKKWDYEVPSVEVWKECLRVLKPGGHLLSFAGSRTYHRIAINIEDAGFDIRDQIMWIYGSGFPKSLNVSKAIDKQFGKEKIIGKGRAGVTALGQSSGYNKTNNPHEFNITEPNSKEAKQWDGWGTGLKPAHEPIVVARKPLSEKTVALNVLKWGTAGINIDGCRIEGEVPATIQGSSGDSGIYNYNNKPDGRKEIYDNTKGRFPANIIFDEEAGRMLDEQSGETRGASRFFYCAKASKSERNKGLEKNNHPTVKPIKLMRYLVRLVTPKGGLCLDPFIGSGTTAIACKLEGFYYLGIERESEYIELAEARIKAYQLQEKLE